MAKSTLEYKRFLTIFVIAVVLLLFCIGITTYIVDPFFQYRVKDNKYILNPFYVNPGLARNYDYNTVIIGSSMVQNYDLSILRKDSVTRPVKLASGAMTLSEMGLMYSLIDREKTNTIIMNLDLVQFQYLQEGNKYQEYLYGHTIIDKLRYLLGYESCMRYVPVDVAMGVYTSLVDEKDISNKIQVRYNVDRIGDFSLDAFFSKNAVRSLYSQGKTVTLPHLFNMQERMLYNIDYFLEYLEVEKHKDTEYIFVLAPYSALYWHVTMEKEYFSILMNSAKYLVNAIEKYPNMRIQCFYDIDEITDLDRYSDLTHFDPSISNFIVNNLRNDKYRLTPTNILDRQNALNKLVTKFKEENKDWIY